MLTELRPKKELLDSNFSGYKLSLDPIPVYRLNVVNGVDHVCQSEDQYSFIHTKLFSLHNHLISDPWHENSIYFIDKKWQVCRARVIPESRKVETLEVVWTIPQLDQRKAGHYNTSLQFPSENTAVLADGCGCLHILDCTNTSSWQCKMSQKVTEDSGCILMSVRFSADVALNCVLMSVVPTTSESSVPEHDPNKPQLASVKTVLYWVVFKKDNEVWNVICTRQLEGRGSVDYVALEPSCNALYVASNAIFEFTADSANPLPPQEKMEEGDKDLPPLVYTWQQSEDDVKIIVEVGENVTRDQVEVIVKGKELRVLCAKNPVIEGPLLHYVDSELTTWSIQCNKLEVVLSKHETGLMWAELIAGDKKGQQVMDPAVVEEVHSRLSHLCSDTEVKQSGEGVAPTFNLDQLEECDAAPEDSRSLVRLEAFTHSVSHYISLAGHQWLMSVLQDPDKPPCICVRHDVDGCVWCPEPPSPPPATEWPCKHIGTFAALGYVAASKQQRKFLVAAPDLSYAVICEVASRVYIYHKATKVDGDLRNRKTSAKITTVAKQQLINLESDAPVLGTCASDNYLFVLTTDTLYTFHIQ